VGVKAEVEKSRASYRPLEHLEVSGNDDEDEEEKGKKGLNEWVELTVEIPGFRDDDAMPIFLAAMLSEALLADAQFTRRLWINSRFHWKLYLDVRYPSKWPSILYEYEDTFANLETDLTPLAAVVVPAAAPLPHHPPRTPLYAASEIEVRGR
jgi:exosome complex component RRP42